MSSERQLCAICNGVLRRNASPQYIDGQKRQFYRCMNCRQGGWCNVNPAGEEDQGHGPVFDGLRGEMAGEIARENAEVGA